jgi:hypothetical protein
LLDPGTFSHSLSGCEMFFYFMDLYGNILNFQNIELDGLALPEDAE